MDIHYKVDEQLGFVKINKPEKLIFLDSTDISNTFKGVIYPFITTTSVKFEKNNNIIKGTEVITDIFPLNYYQNKLNNYIWAVEYNVSYKNLIKNFYLKYQIKRNKEGWIFSSDYNEMILDQLIVSKPTDADMNILAWFFTFSSLRKHFNQAITVMYGGCDLGIHKSIKNLTYFD